MYESFYGLRENPFNVTPDPQFMYLGEKHREALAQLLYGVKEKKGFILITGEIGTGKTTLIHYLLAKLSGSNNTKAAFLFNPKLSVQDFLEYILKDWGIAIQGNSKGDYLYILNQKLLSAYENGENYILIVDEAQGLNPTLLEEIRLLSNLETSKAKLLQIVLMGQPELNKILRQPNFRQLRERINLRYHLRPLSKKETGDYIKKRLTVAGANDPIFTKKAIEQVYHISGGTPRLINILCDNTLVNGYALDQRVIHPKLVREVARDLELEEKLLGRRSLIMLVIFAVACALLFLFLWAGEYVLIIIKGFLKESYKGAYQHIEYFKEIIGNFVKVVS
jgi:general secretion pathway protein A